MKCPAKRTAPDTWWRVPARRHVARALIVFALLAMSVRIGARQAWRADAVASFDDVWTTIDESYYDPSFGGLDWAAVRAELRPMVDAAASPDAARQVIRTMLARLKQSHFVLISSAFDEQTLPGEAAVPIDVRVLDGGALITRVEAGSDAERRGIRAGQWLTRVDGSDVGAWIDQAADAASPAGSDLRAVHRLAWQRVARALHGSSESVVALTVRGADGVERIINASRVAETGTPVAVGNLPPMQVRSSSVAATTPGGRRVGVVRFNVWMTAIAEPFARAVDEFRAADGFVIDLRGNPGGLAEMIRGIGGHFLATPELIGSVHMRGAALEFRANPRTSTPDGRRVVPFGGPLAILVDDLTGSASECFAGGLQSLGRARVFGTRTMGQALPAVTRRLPNGDVLMYAIGDFVTSTGQRLEGDGVVPDEPVTLSPAALADGRDPVLDRALEWIDRRE